MRFAWQGPQLEYEGAGRVWGVRLVTAFTDEHTAAAVGTGRCSDPDAAQALERLPVFVLVRGAGPDSRWPVSGAPTEPHGRQAAPTQSFGE